MRPTIPVAIRGDRASLDLQVPKVSLFAAILLTLSWLPPDIAAMVAIAVDEAASDSELVAAELIVQGKHESGFDKRVQACRRCIAHSFWQLERAPAWDAEKWESFVGVTLEAISAAALESSRQMAHGRRVCRTEAGAVTHYATGHLCKSRKFGKQAQLRAKEIQALRGKLHGMIAS
jgi:hypothetical protein